MTRPGTASVRGSAPGDRAEQGDGEEKLAGASGLAADHGNAPSPGGAGEAPVHGLQPGSALFVRASGGDEGGSGSGAGGGEIAERPGKGLAADKGGGGGAEEMDAFHDRVRFQNQIELPGGSGEDGAVVSDAVAKSG
jgi:hypothetical protein